MTEDDSGLRAFLAEAIPMLEKYMAECLERELVLEIEEFLAGSPGETSDGEGVES